MVAQEVDAKSKPGGRREVKTRWTMLSQIRVDDAESNPKSKSERHRVKVGGSEGGDRCIEYKRSALGTGVAVSNTSNGAKMLSGGEEKRKKV